MKTSDYIVEFLIEKGITDVFGYPGGMVTHLMDSFSKYVTRIKTHVNYHEQASAFSACGYAQIAQRPGVAYATSGPGATNLITGICNAYFDSIPTIFITGQVNTYEAKKELSVRQKGFQETDIISMVKNVTKFCAYVDKAEDIRFYLEKAYTIALEGRPGPVLLDIPMNIQRADIIPDRLKGYHIVTAAKLDYDYDYDYILQLIMESERPCILIGAGLKTSDSVQILGKLVNKLKIPVVSSMVAIDGFPTDFRYNFGFLGAYGSRYSNFILAKSDLILALGTRLDVRQIGGNTEAFAPNSKLIRVEIDSGELTNKIKENEVQINASVKDVIVELEKRISSELNKYSTWLCVCKLIKEKLIGIDKREPNLIVERLSEHIPDHTIITTDVGQNQVWVAQSFKVKQNQKILFTGGHGAMGYSLPAAIGAYYASHSPIVSFNGDGGLQMNIQELQFIKREKLPIKIVVMNNNSLGMIRHFQEMYFSSNYTQTVNNRGYSAPDFELISKAYGLGYDKISCIDDIRPDIFVTEHPSIIEVELHGNTYVYPKLEFGKPNQDQEPQIDRKLYEYIMSL
jgi:acetolactate synthase I/II/III large subunit